MSEKEIIFIRHDRGCFIVSKNLTKIVFQNLSERTHSEADAP